MLSILRKTAASMAKNGGSSFDEQYGVVVFNDDLTTWELVDAAPSDDEDLYSFDGDDDVECRDQDDEPDDDVISDEPEAKPVEEGDEEDDSRESRDLGSPDDVISMETTVSAATTFRYVVMCQDHVYGDGDGHGYDDTDDDDDDDDVYDDDELLAWKLEERFGKQRTKKTTAKRSKQEKSKRRLPYYYNRPGCLYGKHGLGVQNSYI